MRHALPPSFEVERQPQGVRYALPERPPEPGAGPALRRSMLQTIGLLIAGAALGYLGWWKVFAAFGLPALIPAATPLPVLWLQCMGYRTIIRLRKTRLSATRRGRLAWSREKRDIKDLRYLSVVYDAEDATLLAEFWGEEPMVLADAYKRDALTALAHDLADHLREAFRDVPVRKEAPDVEVLVTHVHARRAEDDQPPPFSRATVQREDDQLTVRVPHAPRSSFLRRRVGFIWLPLGVLVVGGLVFLIWWAMQPTTPKPLVWTIVAGVAAMLGLVILHRRKRRHQPTIIDASPAGLVITAPGWWGVRQKVQPADEIQAIEVDESDEFSASLLIHRRGWFRRPIELFQGHDRAELHWLAKVLGEAVEG